MIRGIIPGITFITGAPVIIKAVTGVTIDKSIAQGSPQAMTQMIMHVLIMGPVINTLVFLKKWLTIHIARSAAAVVNLFTLGFISRNSRYF